MVEPPPLAAIRAVNRLVAPCILDAAMVGREGRDFFDALILTAVVQANVAPLMRDTEGQRTYATPDAPPPDDLRRPVSIHAIAQSLRLPYETVRRRIARLAAAGVYEISPLGVIVPARELATPQHVAALFAIWEQIRRLYYRLRETGLLDSLVRPEDRERSSESPAQPPIRAVIRIASDYMLRVIDNVTCQFDGLISGLIWYAVMCANAEHLDAEDDGERRPVTVAQIAERLEAPAETVRRHAVGLIEAGLCQRVRGGLIVPSQVLEAPTALRVMTTNFSDLQRMFSGFAQLGVLTDWDQQAPSLRGAA